MVLEPIFLPIKSISLNSAYKTKTILILFKRLLLLSHISELIHNDSANNFTDNQLNNKQIHKVQHNIAKLGIDKRLNIRISLWDHAGILLEAHIKRKHEAEE